MSECAFLGSCTFTYDYYTKYSEFRQRLTTGKDLLCSIDMFYFPVFDKKANLSVLHRLQYDAHQFKCLFQCHFHISHMMIRSKLPIVRNTPMQIASIMLSPEHLPEQTANYSSPDNSQGQIDQRPEHHTC